MKKQSIISLLLTGMLLASGCSGGGQGTADAEGTEAFRETNETNASSVVLTDTDASQIFSDRDMEIGYDEETSVKIELTGDSASCDSDAVEISESTVTILDEGTYILSGTLDDGMIIVNADDADKVQLVLNGAEIASASSAAIYVLSADKVFLTTASGSENTLSNRGEYVAIDENNIDSVIFSKSDLTLNGGGTLNVNASAGHGIVSKDELVLTSGIYQITAAEHGISGKDNVCIANGTYTITSGKDGIHAENKDDASKGYLYVENGSFYITAEGDGMSAASYLQIEDGEYVVKAGGGSSDTESQSSTQSFMYGRTTQTEETDDSSSTKGVKAATELMINGGSFSIDSADDGLHSNENLTISGGSFEIATDDDGIHADSSVAVSGGSIHITRSYEGIEGLSIDITGGDITLAASDDGLNAAGGNDGSGFGGRGGDMFESTEGAYINISGGTLHVDASGDGIDSNGDLTISGGETYVFGPTDSGNGILDYSGEAVVSGGIFAAAGSSGMMQNFSSSSTQGVMMVSVDSGAAGSTISLSDSSGSEIVSWQAEKAYSCVIISHPEITQGASYDLTADGYSTQITMDSLIYGSGGGTGGRRGMHGGYGGRGSSGSSI